MKGYNIIEEWKSQMYQITSPLAIKRNTYVSRETIDFIYNTLIDFFGYDYFIVNRVVNTRDENLLLSRNAIYQLLHKMSDNSFNSITEIAALLAFSKKLPTTIHDKIVSVKSDIKALRNYLFEIFIYRMFIGNNITLNIKPLVKGKELEALFSFNGKLGVIECKKLYNTEIIKQSHLEYCFHIFFRAWIKKIQLGIFAFIISPTNDEKSYAEEKEIITKGIEQYMEELKIKQTMDFIFERFNSKGQKILHIEKNKPGLFENMKLLFKEPYAFFSAYPPSSMKVGGYNYFRFYNGYYYTVSAEDINRKIIKEIEKKRRQHKDLNTYYNLYFFENEASNFGEFPLVTDSIINSDLILNHVKSKETNDIICIIDKMFFPNKRAKIKMHIYCKEELRDIKSQIENFDLKVFHE